jgi:sugar lactone lactonase YvrE
MRTTTLAIAALLAAAGPARAADQTIAKVCGTAVNITMDAPRGLARDASGCIYIADSLNHRVLKFDPLGGFSTVAGTGSAGYTGDGGAATAARLDRPYGVAVDASDNLYIADMNNHVIRKVTAVTGLISTYAGTGSDGNTGNGGAATAAKLGDPYGVALDSAGNLHIADKKYHVVRKVTAATGVISAVAGTGSAGYTGDGGAATSAKLDEPYDVALDGSDNVYIADMGNDVIRKVTAASGVISTFAGTGTGGYTGDGGAATSARLNEPYGVGLDASDNLYIAQRKNYVVRKVNASDLIITTVAGTGSNGYTGDDDLATLAELSEPYDVAVSSTGDLYIADGLNDVVRRVDGESQVITTINSGGSYTGDGGLAVLAKVNQPWDMAVDSSGNVYIADTLNHVVRRIDGSSGVITIVAGTGSDGYTGDGGAATSARLGEPYGVALDSSGNIYIADKKKHVVRKVTAATGIITTVAGSGSAGSSGDGGAATSAKLNEPHRVAVDSSGDIYIADKRNHKVRKVTAATGVISTYAGTGSDGYTGDGGAATSAALSEPYGVTLDQSGNVYIADRKKHVVRKITASTGIITTIAGTGSAGHTGDGGSATSAKLEEPHDVAVDRDGNVYIAVKKRHVVRKIDGTTGIITTVVGTAGTSGSTGDGGLASLALLFEPKGVALDREGDLYIADTRNNTIRKCDFGDFTARIVRWQEVAP